MVKEVRVPPEREKKMFVVNKKNWRKNGRNHKIRHELKISLKRNQ